MSHASLCEVLRDAFLRGEEVNPTTFARAQGVSRQGVYLAMAHFGGLVCRGARRGTLKCCDMQAMRDFRAPSAGGRTRGARRAAPPAPTAWAQLLNAWGIPTTPPEIDLPTHFHTMATAEDRTEQTT